MKQTITHILKSLTFILLLVSIQPLSIRQNHQKARHDMVQKFAKKTHHKLNSLFHIQSLQQEEDRQIGIEFLQQFMAFIFTDKQISDSIFKGTPLSQQSGERIKNFFLTNKSFIDLLLQLLDEDPKAPQCYLNMDVDKKKKIIFTALEEYDIIALLNSESVSETNKDQIQKIKQKITANPDLGPTVLECLNKNPNFLLLSY